jgi:NAD(P)-dependent dehydrogenase (short-subunit alcohol dehydrogenase family)
MFFESAKTYTPRGEKMTMEELNTGVSTMSPLKRPGVPEDVAGLVSLIASPEAQWMTDQTFHCSGGAHMGTA